MIEDRFHGFDGVHRRAPPVHCVNDNGIVRGLRGEYAENNNQSTTLVFSLVIHSYEIMNHIFL